MASKPRIDLRTSAEHLRRSLMLLGFVPIHSGSHQCLNVVSYLRFFTANTAGNMSWTTFAVSYRFSSQSAIAVATAGVVPPFAS
jgi:hypothetical protein